jgi:hypothetical protein
MVIYSPSSIKMGFGNTSAARSLRLTGTTRSSPPGRPDVAASCNDET